MLNVWQHVQEVLLQIYTMTTRAKLQALSGQARMRTHSHTHTRRHAQLYLHVAAPAHAYRPACAPTTIPTPMHIYSWSTHSLTHTQREREMTEARVSQMHVATHAWACTLIPTPTDTQLSIHTCNDVRKPRAEGYTGVAAFLTNR